MKLRENEQVVKVFHHHKTAIILRALKIVAASLPFYFVANFFNGYFNVTQMFYLYAGITLLFAAVMAYDIFFYYRDRLIITNHRIVHIDWNGAFSNNEHEAEIRDIQDIATKEKGLFAKIKIFDFGDFTLETASTHTTIYFPEAPDPEGIKHFIYHLHRKPNRIRNGGLSTTDDKARQQTEDAVAVSRRQ